MSQTGGSSSSATAWTGQSAPLGQAAPIERRTKARSVSEARKKAVAASQGWKCSACNNVLSATYEVDHIIELQDGGSNEVDNLTAMCRNCHGDKTLRERLGR